MSRYIDAEWLKEKVEVVSYKNEWYETEIDEFVSMENIDNAPSIDIVRCKECRYCKRKRGTFKGEPIIFYRCEENNRDVDSDDFCSYGERREP